MRFIIAVIASAACTITAAILVVGISIARGSYNNMATVIVIAVACAAVGFLTFNFVYWWFPKRLGSNR